MGVQEVLRAVIGDGDADELEALVDVLQLEGAQITYTVKAPGHWLLETKIITDQETIVSTTETKPRLATEA